MQKDHWTLQPGTFIEPERYGDIHYAINAHGFRDGEFSFDKTSKRVLFLGDSVAYGLSVPAEQTYFRRLKSELQRTLGVEAYSLALLGYSPFDHLNAWQRIGKDLKPDVVVLELVSNDFFVEPIGTPLPLTFWQKVQLGWANLSDHSALMLRLGQVRAGLINLAFHDLRREYYPDSLYHDEPEQMLDRWQKVTDREAVGGVKQLRELIAGVRATGARMIVIYTPWEVQLFTDKYDGLNREIARVFEGADVTFLDPLHELRASSDRIHVFREGVHFADAGHAIIADFLKDTILESLGATSK